METTPFAVFERVTGTTVKYVVMNGWTGKEYGTFPTREAAEREAERLKRERG